MRASASAVLHLHCTAMAAFALRVLLLPRPHRAERAPRCPCGAHDNLAHMDLMAPVVPMTT